MSTPLEASRLKATVAVPLAKRLLTGSTPYKKQKNALTIMHFSMPPPRIGRGSWVPQTHTLSIELQGQKKF